MWSGGRLDDAAARKLVTHPAAPRRSGRTRGGPASGARLHPATAPAPRHTRLWAVADDDTAPPSPSRPMEAPLLSDPVAAASTEPVGYSRRFIFTCIAAAAALAVTLLNQVMAPAPAFAAVGPGQKEDTAAIGICVIKQCAPSLAKCIINPMCLANLVCINTCANRPDETECQIQCGDLFENPVVGEFNACAVSQKQCVPKRVTYDYPVPPDDAIASQFFTNKMNGQWYIAAGLNPIFDTFDCQVHFFESPAPGRLYGKLNWRIDEPDGEFFTRSTVQRFMQDPKKPGVLYNHDNEYLHYEDDWYILDWSEDTDPIRNPDAYILVYYRGRNDAWDGYGGAVLYTRATTVPQSIRPRVVEACRKAGIDYAKFRECDNTCAAEANPTLLREQYAKSVLLTSEKNVENSLAEELTRVRQNAVSAEQAVVDEEKTIVREFSKDEKMLAKELADAVTVLEKKTVSFEKQLVKTVVGGAGGRAGAVEPPR